MHFHAPRLLTALAISIVIAVAGGSSPSGAPAQRVSLEASVQIAAVLAEKDARTPIEQKIDSQLLYASRQAMGQAMVPGLASLAVEIPDSDGTHVVVDVSATVSPELIPQMAALGANVTYVNAEYHTLRLDTTFDRLIAIAALPDVAFINRRQDWRSSEFNPGAGVPTPIPGAGHEVARTRALDRAVLAREITGAFARLQDRVTNVGSKQSEGDATHQAAAARSTFGVDGTGIKVGVISDGVSSLATAQASGDLGAVTILSGQSGAGNEGVAMLEIVHDLAPGALLYFATATPTITQFAQNIRDLRNAGCDIIVDDVSYFVESPFTDGQTGFTSPGNAGVVTQAVNDVTAGGVLYFSSAGDKGSVDHLTSGTWEGDFADGGVVGPPVSPATSGNYLDFGGQNYVQTLANGHVILYWSDPLGGSSNDYDLCRLTSDGLTLVSCSTNVQNGTQDPIEDLGDTGALRRIVVVKRPTAAARFLHLASLGAGLTIATVGGTYGHSSAAAAFSVAATAAATTPFGGPNGPYPNPFNASNQAETFSADGPRRLFYNANGAAFTPGNVSSTGGVLRQKPDLTAADGVQVSGAGGFPSPFFGTSAAAAHAAAIAALVKARNYGLSTAQVRAALTSTAIDIETAGVDRTTGAGIIMANAAVGSVTAPATALSRTPAALNVAATKAGAGSATLVNVTPPQNVTIGFTGPTPSWTATPNESWLQVTNASQTGRGAFSVSVVNPGNVIGGSTSLVGTIRVLSPTANPVVITVNLTVQQSVGSSAAPFGQLDTPAQNAAGLQGAIALTGWTLDDIGVGSLQVFRQCFAFDNPASCQVIGSDNVVYIGDGNFVSGARPDVEAAFPNLPLNYRAGWGLLVLSNFLPHVPNSQVFGGQGTLQFYVYANDVENHRTLLGRSAADHTPTTVTLDNDHIAKPFGNLDTPIQSGTVSGVTAVSGWALTPDLNTVVDGTDILIPTNGSTVTLFVDGSVVGTMAYNQCRGNVGNPPPAGVFCNDDVSNAFGNLTPQPTFTTRTSNPTKFRNLDAARGPIASRVLDTAGLTNGQHTIGLTATDNASSPRSDGIGSRFFVVANGGGGAALSDEQIAALLDAPAKSRGPASSLDQFRISGRPIAVRRGFDLRTVSAEAARTASGVRTVTMPATGRLELSLATRVTAGYLVTNGELRDLPVGSHLDTATGVFSWMPPAGYFGVYRLAFIVGGERLLVDVTVQ